MPHGGFSGHFRKWHTTYCNWQNSMVGSPNICQIVLKDLNFYTLIWLEVKYTFPVDIVEINIIEALDIQGDLYLALGGRK